jgi:hypothetical protein
MAGGVVLREMSGPLYALRPELEFGSVGINDTCRDLRNTARRL